MSESNSSCGGMGCSTARDQVLPSATPAETASVFRIDIVSDVICPWCFIGKRRLEKALKLLDNPPEVKVNWRPFQLNPQMPSRRHRAASVPHEKIRQLGEITGSRCPGRGCWCRGGHHLRLRQHDPHATHAGCSPPHLDGGSSRCSRCRCGTPVPRLLRGGAGPE